MSESVNINPGLNWNSSENARDAFLERIHESIDLPAMGSSVSKVVQISSDDDQSLNELTYFVLSDVALSQKVLRLANTAFYATGGGTPVTTISRAISLLGFDTVRTSALSMMLVEKLANVRHSQTVRSELAKALRASIIGRELTRNARRQGAEEAAIAALFSNIGQVLVAAVSYEDYLRINALVARTGITPDKACFEIMGCTFHMIAQSVVKEWDLPGSLAQAVAPLPPGPLRAPARQIDWVQQTAALSFASGVLLSNASDEDKESARKAIIKRFGESLGITNERLLTIASSVEKESRLLAELLGLRDIDETPELAELPPEDLSLPEGLLMHAPDVHAAPAMTERHPSGKPLNARERLLAGVQEITLLTASGNAKANEVILQVLETIYSSMGFRFATMVLRDVAAREYRSRLALGEQAPKRKAAMVFPEKTASDIFTLSMANDADLMIADSNDPKIRRLLPAWHLKEFPDTRSFIVIPIVIEKNPVGFFYGDRDKAAPEGVSPEETSLLKILKTQVLSALIKR